MAIDFMHWWCDQHLIPSQGAASSKSCSSDIKVSKCFTSQALKTKRTIFINIGRPWISYRSSLYSMVESWSNAWDILKLLCTSHCFIPPLVHLGPPKTRTGVRIHVHTHMEYNRTNQKFKWNIWLCMWQENRSNHALCFCHPSIEIDGVLWWGLGWWIQIQKGPAARWEDTYSNRRIQQEENR